MQKGGFFLSGFGRAGKISIDTYDRKHEFNILSGYKYGDCLELVQSVPEDKLLNRSPLLSVKYCPQCGEEFQEWVTHCPDCGVELVDELPEYEEDTEDADAEYELTSAEVSQDLPDVDGVLGNTMVSIARAPNEMVANLWKGMLEEHGIACMITKSGLSGHPHYASAAGECLIIVMVSKAKKAWQILEPFMDV